MTDKGAGGEAGEGRPVFESMERIETPHGTIQLELTSETVGRAICGPETGFLKLDGRDIYAYAMLRRPEGGDTWMIHPVYGNVWEVDDGKAGPRAETDVRDRAWEILRDAFVEWLPTRPDIVAGVALAVRRREESVIEEQADELRSRLAGVEADLTMARTARKAAEEEFERASEPAPGPTP